MTAGSDSTPVAGGRRFELVVFDWDGTLMDSAARIIVCMQAAARDTGLRPLAPAQVRHIIGLGLMEACRALYPQEDEARVARLAEAYRTHYFSAGAEPSTLFPGAAQVVADLEQQGYWLAVATGKSRVGLRRVLAETGLGRHFHASRCADETVSKPHPRMLLEIMDELGVEPAATLMVGDTDYDLLMARDAGVAAVGVCYGAHPLPRLLACDPLVCLEDIRDLPTFLETPPA